MKKWILLLLAVICATLCAFGLAACVPKNLEAHSWSEDWKHSIDEHWHYCTLRSDCDAKNDKAPHNLTVLEVYKGKEPTCGNTGRGVLKCEDCGVTIEDAIPATGDHAWEIINQVDATCLAAGQITKYCPVCFTVETEEIPVSDHVYLSGKWTATETGHQQVCTVCGTPSGLIPHEEKRTNYVAPNNSNEVMSDGSWDIVCSICNYKIRTEEERNPYAPTRLDVKLYLNGQEVPRTLDGNGWRVDMAPSGVGVTPMYLLSFAAYKSDGSAHNYIREAVMDNENGIRAYLRDKETYEDRRLDMNYHDYIIFGFTSGNSATLRVVNPGDFTVVFNYETGEMYSDQHKVRASFIMYIHCEAGRAVSASEVGERVCMVSDVAECLSNGYYETKNS